MSAIIPIPKIPITIRPGTMDDLPFIDSLQKKNTKQVGFMPTKQFEGKIKAGHVLVAEERHEGTQARRHEVVMEEEGKSAESALGPSLPGPHFVPTCLRASVPNPVGYLIGNDQYFKRDDCGIIYQINIAESHRRSLVGAMLLKAQFERSAYGCRLYCCWCAQDIEANRFWESMGFVPLAFRAGSAKKSRVHIFWQKRIRQGDCQTPYWFPAQTNSGSIREDRLVLPIPPGRHWSEEMPRILPSEERGMGVSPVLPSPKRGRGAHATGKPVPQIPTRLSRQFAPPGAKPRPELTPEPAPVAEKQKPVKKPKQKNDPKLIAAARELRDRWLERVNEDPSLLVSNGKYEVCRLPEPTEPRPAKLLMAA
jgi:hypothetical protein